MTEPSSRYGPSSRCRARRSTYCSPTALRLATTASVSAGIGVGVGVDGQDDADAVVDQLHVGDPADGDAAVGDLGVDEDAAGVVEVGGDLVAGAEQQRGPARRTEAEVGHAEHGDGQRTPAAAAWWCG